MPTDEQVRLSRVVARQDNRLGTAGRAGWGTAAQRPAAGPDALGMYWFSTDTGGGTLYLCTFETSGGYVWTTVGRFLSEWVSEPATKTSTGTAGQKASNATHVFFCIATDSWVRCARDTAGGW